MVRRPNLWSSGEWWVVPQHRFTVQLSQFRPLLLTDRVQSYNADSNDVGRLDERDLSSHPLPAFVDVLTVGVNVETARREALTTVHVRDVIEIDVGLSHEGTETVTCSTDEWAPFLVFGATGRLSNDGNGGTNVAVPRNGCASGGTKITKGAVAKVVAE